MGWFGHVSTGGHGRQLHTSNTAWSYGCSNGSSGNIGRSISTGCSSSIISSFSISSICNGSSSSSNNRVIVVVVKVVLILIAVKVVTVV